MKKGILIDATTYVLPIEICSMVNVVLDAKNQSLKLCAVDGVDVVSKFLLDFHPSVLRLEDKKRHDIHIYISG